MSDKKKDCNATVDLLKRDYLLRTRDDLNKRIAEVAQDFVTRGLYNSTACIGKQLQVHFEHKRRLVEHIIESVTKDFPSLSLSHLRDSLYKVLDEEYKNLVPFANSFLVSAGLAQENILRSSQVEIDRKKGEAKQAVETRLAVMKKQRVLAKGSGAYERAETQGHAPGSEEGGVLEPRPPEILQNLLWVLKHGKKYWKLITLAVVLIIGVLVVKSGVLERLNWRTEKEVLDEYGRTRLYARTKKRIDDHYEKIDKQKLSPWIFIRTGKMPEITKADGRVISYRGDGSDYSGSPRIVFWGDDFVPPLIEAAILQVFDEIIEECRANKLGPKPYVDEAHRLLHAFIWRVYNRMAEIDRRLLAKHTPEDASRRDVTREIDRMEECLKEHYDAATLLSSSQ
jgi:hypothetical protein